MAHCDPHDPGLLHSNIYSHCWFNCTPSQGRRTQSGWWDYGLTTFFAMLMRNYYLCWKWECILHLPECYIDILSFYFMIVGVIEAHIAQF